jgi:hypothetical protein
MEWYHEGTPLEDMLQARLIPLGQGVTTVKIENKSNGMAIARMMAIMSRIIGTVRPDFFSCGAPYGDGLPGGRGRNEPQPMQ